MRSLLLATVSLWLSVSAVATPPLRIGFFNVENLYDTINDPSVDDAEFLPTAPARWSGAKYMNKIESVASAIELFNPDVLGVCEVENRAVLDDLVRRTGRYSVVHYDSRDSRGIDVAMLVDTSKVSIQGSEPVVVGAGIRDFLRVDLRCEEFRFSIYVVHLPSKRGGARAATRRQIAVKVIDSIAGARYGENVIFCGDFNDAPTRWANIDNAALAPSSRGRGSYAYGDRWTMIDQFLVSYSLRGSVGDQQVVVDRSLITPAGRFQGYPRRGSPSDHLPVFILLKMRSVSATASFIVP